MTIKLKYKFLLQFKWTQKIFAYLLKMKYFYFFVSYANFSYHFLMSISKIYVGRQERGFEF